MPEKKPRKPLTLSKRAAGFKVALTNTHLLSLHQTYCWLAAQGMTDEMTDEAIKVIPTYDEPIEAVTDIDIVLKNGVRCMRFMPTRDADGKWKDNDCSVNKMNTVRIRAEHLVPVARLFRLVAAFNPFSQLARTFVTRAEALEEVSALDQLVDAQRGPALMLKD
ncbi:MAG: hypothetical protein AB7L09_02170 [Nitrospira sp.]